MPLRQLTAAFSMLLLGHLLVAQSLLACGFASESGRNGSNAAAAHCHDSAMTRHSATDKSAASGPADPSSDHSPATPPCCTIALSCGAASFLGVVARAERPAVDRVTPLVNTPTGLAGRVLGPEPPPPKQLRS